MPELPELQAHAERLTVEFGGSVLQGFRPITFTALKTFSPDPGASNGQVLTGIGRRGKYLLLAIGDVTFVVHLMQGGRLRPDEKQTAKPRGGIARWSFEDGRALLLTEPGSERKAGVWVVAGDVETQDPILGLGPDADQLDVGQLAVLLKAHPMRVHGFLRDQHLIAGVGRRLANEICHRAKLSPFAGTAKLDAEQVDRLAAAIAVSIAESLAEERELDEMVNAKARSNRVHNRVGEPCPVCGDAIRSVEYRSYTVGYCPTCQTGGRTLADNTTSRFLK